MARLGTRRIEKLSRSAGGRLRGATRRGGAGYARRHTGGTEIENERETDGDRGERERRMVRALGDGGGRGERRKRETEKERDAGRKRQMGERRRAAGANENSGCRIFTRKHILPVSLVGVVSVLCYGS